MANSLSRFARLWQEGIAKMYNHATSMEQATDWQIFVSYSHADVNIVAPLTELIRVTGAATFRDEDSIPKGKRWSMVISNSLATCKTVLVFWSADSANSSAVAEEFTKAIELGKDVVPVLLDGTELDSALREYQWIDLRAFIKIGRQNVAVVEEELKQLPHPGLFPDPFHRERMRRLRVYNETMEFGELRFRADELRSIAYEFYGRIVRP